MLHQPLSIVFAAHVVTLASNGDLSSHVAVVCQNALESRSKRSMGPSRAVGIVRTPCAWQCAGQVQGGTGENTLQWEQADPSPGRRVPRGPWRPRVGSGPAASLVRPGRSSSLQSRVPSAAGRVAARVVAVQIGNRESYRSGNPRIRVGPMTSCPNEQSSGIHPFHTTHGVRQHNFMDAWIHGCLDAWMHGCLDACVYYMHAWMHGWICGCMQSVWMRSPGKIYVWLTLRHRHDLSRWIPGYVLYRCQE